MITRITGLRSTLLEASWETGEVISGKRSRSGCESQEAGTKKNLVGQVPSPRESLTVILTLRKDD